MRLTSTVRKGCEQLAVSVVGDSYLLHMPETSWGSSVARRNGSVVVNDVGFVTGCTGRGGGE